MIMIQTEIDETEQLSVFKRQFDQYLIRNQLSKCKLDKLEFENNTIEFDKNRIVKRPGYEILLEGVEEGYYVCSNPLELNISLEGVMYNVSFKIP